MGLDYQTVTPYNENIIEVINQKEAMFVDIDTSSFTPVSPHPQVNFTPNHFKVSDPIAYNS